MGLVVTDLITSPVIKSPASEQERQVVARVTAGGHESDSGERVTASGHSDLPGGQGDAYTDDVTGSGQKSETGLSNLNNAKINYLNNYI